MRPYGGITRAAVQSLVVAAVAAGVQWPVGVYGNGADGTIDLDGTNTYPFLTKSGNDYTTTRSFFATTLRVRAGCTLIKRHVAYVNDTLTVEASGVISDDGNPAVGVTGGTGFVVSSSPRLPDCGTGNGGAGKSSLGTGSGGTSVTSALGGSGGIGGLSRNFVTTGGGGSVTGLGPSASPVQGLGFLSIFLYGAAASVSRVNGGAGGAGGACTPGSGTATSGAGGAGGPVSILFARRIVNNGVIRCNGGAGSSASGVTGDGSAGGGGGGGGGYLIVVSNTSRANAGVLQANGGPGGAGAGAEGMAGSAGSNGTVDYRAA